MILPWLTFALFFLPLYTRMIRARVLETLDASHVAAARAKGASEFRVLRSHVLRPALLPIVTMVGMDLGGALMASMYIETMYGSAASVDHARARSRAAARTSASTCR